MRFTPLGEALSLATLARHRAALVQLVEARTALATIGYVCAYAAAVALSIPGAVVMTLTGGFLFGAWLGTALAVLGATIGAVLTFLFARRLFGERALDRLGPRAQGLAAGIRREAWSYLLVLRLVPLFPFVLVNLVTALVGVPFRTYLLTTVIGILPGTAVFALSGAGLGRILDSGATPDLRAILTPEILAGLLGLAALSLAAIPLRRRFAERG